MADLGSKNGDWFTRNLGYQMAINNLDQRIKYLAKPEEYLKAQKAALTENSKGVAAIFEEILTKFKALGYPDNVARDMAMNYARNASALANIEMQAQFPDTLFSDAKSSAHGQLEAKYGARVAADIIGIKPHKLHKKHKKHHKD